MTLRVGDYGYVIFSNIWKFLKWWRAIYYNLSSWNLPWSNIRYNFGVEKFETHQKNKHKVLQIIMENTNDWDKCTRNFLSSIKQVAINISGCRRASQAKIFSTTCRSRNCWSCRNATRPQPTGNCHEAGVYKCQVYKWYLLPILLQSTRQIWKKGQLLEIRRITALHKIKLVNTTGEANCFRDPLGRENMGEATDHGGQLLTYHIGR